MCTYFFSPDDDDPSPLAGLVYKTVQPNGDAVEQNWEPNVSAISQATWPSNAYVFSQANVLGGETPVTCGNPTQETATEATASLFWVDQNGNVTSTMQAGWTNYSNLQHGNPTVVGQNFLTPCFPNESCGTLVKYTGATYSPNINSSDSGNWDSNAYYNLTVGFPEVPPAYYQGLLVRSAVLASTGAGPGSMTEYSYTSVGANVSAVSRWDSTKAATMPEPWFSTTPLLNSSNAVVTSSAYSSNGAYPGLLTDYFDGNGNQTHYAYDANKLYVIQKTEAINNSSYSRPTTYGNDFQTGLLTADTDYNGLSHRYCYDGTQRLTTTYYLSQPTSSGDTSPTCSSQPSSIMRVSSTTYNDAGLQIVHYEDLNNPGDAASVSVASYDDLGRERLSQQMTSSTESTSDYTRGIKVMTRHVTQSGHSYDLVTSPFLAPTSSQACPAPQNCAEPTMGWNATTHDRNGRIVRAENFSGSSTPSCTGAAYCTGSSTGFATTLYQSSSTLAGPTVQHTDEFGVISTKTFDALGRMVSLQENGISATTSYAYDALNNLMAVTPPSGNARAFNYDSIGRLASSGNPENATTTYTYDNNGNRTQRTDSSGNVTNYGFDPLNRLTAKCYAPTPAACYSTTPATPTVTYNYFNVTDDLASVSSSASTYAYSNCDALGRLAAASQSNPLPGGGPFTFFMSYYPQGTGPSTRGTWNPEVDMEQILCTLNPGAPKGREEDWAAECEVSPDAIEMDFIWTWQTERLAKGSVVDRLSGGGVTGFTTSPAVLTVHMASRSNTISKSWP